MGSFSLGPRARIIMKIVRATAMRMKLAKTVAPAYKVGWLLANSVFMSWMKMGPFSKAPATSSVAPVSDNDLENASMKAAINEGLMIGNVTVLAEVKGGAPRVLEAFSYSLL